MPCQVVRRAVKALFIIDGVAERKTSHMLQNSLASRLDFPCYVQVVANYVLAFDLAMQQGFDVLVLPHAAATDGYSKADFVEDVTNTCGFSSNLVYTVDHDSASHQLGRTIRSTRTGGYMVDDLIAALTCVAKKSTIGKKVTKRSRQDCQPVAYQGAPEQEHFHRHKQARPAQEQPYRQASAEEIAYWQHYHWQMQWQRYHQAQAHADAHAQRQVYPEYPPHYTAGPRVISAISATPQSPLHPVIPHPHLLHYHQHLTQHLTQHHHHHQLHAQHQVHSHPFPTSHPTQSPFANRTYPSFLTPQSSELGPHFALNTAQHQALAPQQHQQPHASLHCASHEEEEEQEALTRYGSLAADAHVCGSDSSCGCTTTESLDSAESMTSGDACYHRDSIDIDIFDFDENMFNI